MLFRSAVDVPFEAGDEALEVADAGLQAGYETGRFGGGGFGFGDGAGFAEERLQLVSANELETVEVPTGLDEVIDTVVGVFVGAVTFTGSIVAYGKLQGVVRSKPLLLPGRHALNLIGILACVYLGYVFLASTEMAPPMWPLLVCTAIACLIGIHLVMAIGGADMPVVVSMLNSYSGWAAAAAGFMLANDLLIITGALVGDRKSTRLNSSH